MVKMTKIKERISSVNLVSVIGLYYSIQSLFIAGFFISFYYLFPIHMCFYRITEIENVIAIFTFSLNLMPGEYTSIQKDDKFKSFFIAIQQVIYRDRFFSFHLFFLCYLAPTPGLEPRTKASKAFVLPITPSRNYFTPSRNYSDNCKAVCIVFNLIISCIETG